MSILQLVWSWQLCATSLMHLSGLVTSCKFYTGAVRVKYSLLARNVLCSDFNTCLRVNLGTICRCSPASPIEFWEPQGYALILFAFRTNRVKLNLRKVNCPGMKAHFTFARLYQSVSSNQLSKKGKQSRHRRNGLLSYSEQHT